MWQAPPRDSFSHSPAVAVALHEITTCPLVGGPASRCYSSPASSASVWWYFQASFFFPFFSFCAILPTEISVVPSWVAQTVCTGNLLYLTSLISFDMRGARLLCIYIEDGLCSLTLKAGLRQLLFNLISRDNCGDDGCSTTSQWILALAGYILV